MLKRVDNLERLDLLTGYCALTENWREDTEPVQPEVTLEEVICCGGGLTI